MELLTLAGQQRLVDGLGEQRVTEAEAAVRLIRHQDVVLDGLAQRLGDRELRRVHHDGQQPVRDVPAGGGDDAQHRSGVRIEAGDAGDQQVMQRRREVVLAARGGRRKLDREERVALRASAHRCRQLSGQRLIDARGDEGLDVLVGERPELNHDGASGPAKPGAEAVQRMLGRDRVAAVGRDDEHAAPLDRVREVGDEIERRSVGPVQILEQQNDRSAPADVLEDGEHLGEQTQLRRGSVAVRGERGAVGEVGMQARQLVQLVADLAEVGRAAERAERLDEREIGQARADEVDAAAAEDRRPLAARPGCELRCQDGLADPRRAGDQRGRAEAPGGRLEGHLQPLQLVGAPDEHVGHVVVGLVTGRPVDDGEADRPTLCAVVAWAQVERRILVEHLALKVVERRGRFHPELLLQRRAELVVDRERLGLAPRPVEGAHQLAARSLAQRVGRHQGAKLADEVGVMAECEVGLDAVLDAHDPQLLEVLGVRGGERLGELGQRRAPPQGESGPQALRGRLGVPRGQRRPALLAQPCELHEVDGLRGDLERVPGRPRAQDPVRKDLAQLRDVDVHHLDRRRRHLLAPQRVHDRVDRHGAVDVDQQARQQRAALPTGQRQVRPAIGHLERAEDAVLRHPARQVYG